MRTLSLLVLALSIPSTALAKRGRGGGGGDGDGGGDGSMRVKVDTSIGNMSTLTMVPDSGDEQGAKTTNLTLGGDPARLYGGYLLNKKIEVGGILEFGSHSVQPVVDGKDEGDPSKSGSLGVYAAPAYNHPLGDGMWAYAQPIAGIYKTNSTTTSTTTTVNADGTTDTDTTEVESSSSFLVYGADAGLRVAMAKGASLDLAAEYLTGSGTDTVDGKEQDTYSWAFSIIGLRAGVALKF